MEARMSRNLGYGDHCGQCSAAVKVVGETKSFGEVRPNSPYLPEYHAMMVADAECPDCGAKYLAWMTYGQYGGSDVPIDLSYRSTFNDEPGEADMPDPERLAQTEGGIRRVARARAEATFEVATGEKISYGIEDAFGQMFDHLHDCGLRMVFEKIEDDR
jgi:hypothetical protein